LGIFATAVFLLLNRDSGELSYVNAGHNAPIIFGHGVTKLLEATGLPLGLFNDSEYEARTARLDPGNSLLLFTDGLTDAIAGDDPGGHLRATLGGDIEKTMLRLRSLVDSKLNRDDVTIVLVARLRLSSGAPTSYSGKSDG
jgi:serine phosphatase RsbU (regulator of sigma subunit)